VERLESFSSSLVSGRDNVVVIGAPSAQGMLLDKPRA
jgi:hypothetical protein